MIRIIQGVSFITLAAAICLILLIAYWLLYPYEVLTQVQPGASRILNTNKTVQVGGALLYQVDVIHHTNGVRVSVSREIRDTSLVSFPITSYVSFPGRSTFINTLVIPDYLPSSTYRLDISSTFYVNPLRTIVTTRSTEDFIVIAKGDKSG